MVIRYFDGIVPVPSGLQEIDEKLRDVSGKVLPQVSQQIDDLAFNKALASIWEVVSATNKYIDETAPWTLAKAEKDRPRLGTVLYNALESLRISALLLAAYMPATSEKIWSQLGMETGLWEQRVDEDGRWGGLKPGKKLAKPAPLFPRIDTPKPA